ncbi:hypothetical protein IMZ48_28180 [Candidatus Bathyarchaeota archaeon]|nr:hypothetical protein [Candidatus Bathyarchaeota archaeon]
MPAPAATPAARPKLGSPEWHDKKQEEATKEAVKNAKRAVELEKRIRDLRDDEIPVSPHGLPFVFCISMLTCCCLVSKRFAKKVIVNIRRHVSWCFVF